MQFIPSTWSVVGVDADGDGERNPQDIDDAALATAVYLCSGKDDLGATQGQRAAVYRYNHSWSYVDLVLSIMDAYLAGDYTSIPNGTTSAGYYVPSAPATSVQAKGKGKGNAKGSKPGKGGTGGSGPADDETVTTAPPPSSPGEEPEAPSQPNLPGTGGGDGGGVKLPDKPISTALPTQLPEPVKDVVTEAEARVICLANWGVNTVTQLLVKGISLAALNECIATTRTDN